MLTAITVAVLLLALEVWRRTLAPRTRQPVTLLVQTLLFMISVGVIDGIAALYPALLDVEWVVVWHLPFLYLATIAGTWMALATTLEVAAWLPVWLIRRRRAASVKEPFGSREAGAKFYFNPHAYPTVDRDSRVVVINERGGGYEAPKEDTPSVLSDPVRADFTAGISMGRVDRGGQS